MDFAVRSRELTEFFGARSVSSEKNSVSSLLHTNHRCREDSLSFSPWNSVRAKTLTDFVGPATTQNLVVKFDGEICGGVLVENASGDFPQQKKLKNPLPNFAGSSPPISPKTSPTSLWKSLVLNFGVWNRALHNRVFGPSLLLGRGFAESGCIGGPSLGCFQP